MWTQGLADHLSDELEFVAAVVFLNLFFEHFELSFIFIFKVLVIVLCHFYNFFCFANSCLGLIYFYYIFSNCSSLT